MATVTEAPRQARTRPDPTERLWQVPLFLIGIAAFVCAYQGWLIGPRDPASAFRNDVASLAVLATKQNPDLNELKSSLSRVQPHSIRSRRPARRPTTRWARDTSCSPSRPQRTSSVTSHMKPAAG